MNFGSISRRKMAFKAILLVIVIFFLVSLSSLLCQNQGGQKDIIRQKRQVQGQQAQIENQQKKVEPQHEQSGRLPKETDKKQQQQEYGPEEPAQNQPEDFSTEEIQKYIKAKQEAEKIRQVYVDKLRHVAESDEALRIRDKYTRQINEAIEKNGLSVNKYNEIRQSLQNSPELQKMVNKMEEQNFRAE